MTTDTKERILQFVKLNGRAKVKDLVGFLGLGNVAIHRQLKKLVENGELKRLGSPPKVFYIIAEKSQEGALGVAVELTKIVNDTYLYVSPSGDLLYGMDGFGVWAKKVGRDLGKAAREYVDVRLAADKFISTNGYVDATEKIQNTFDRIFVDKVLYKDFYSLPTFGKTKLGQLVLYAKQAQNTELVKLISDQIRELILKIIKKYKIRAIGWLPHSIPRKIQFLKELKKDLNIQIQEVDLVKAYSGQVPVAQKTLSKLEERVENARKTIMIGELGQKFDKVLLIDDAIGSGATLNETAMKLKETGMAKEVIGFAIVGSMKGFEVIREV